MQCFPIDQYTERERERERERENSRFGSWLDRRISCSITLHRRLLQDKGAAALAPRKDEHTGKIRGPEIPLRAQAHLRKEFAQATAAAAATPGPGGGSSGNDRTAWPADVAAALVKGEKGEPQRRLKGHKVDREALDREKRIADAMEKMPQIVAEYRERKKLKIPDTADGTTGDWMMMMMMMMMMMEKGRGKKKRQKIID